YEITKELGEGGFGKTFLAIDLQKPSRPKCVIKQLKPNNDPRTEQIIKERFAQEAKILETLGNNAPNHQIPRLDAYFDANNQFYLVQEFVDGESLRDKLNKGQRFSESDVRNILINILPVLEYIHSQKIIHRDIKPDNIIIRNADNQPVLIDFGAVKETLSTTVTTGGNVTSSIVIGTPGYMPPEQGAGRPVNSSDLFSLALTLIELLTGKMPNELQTNQQTGEIEWKIGINVSREIGEILDKAISYHPRDRYSSASLMLNVLQPQTTQGFTQPTNNYSPQSTEVSAPPIYQQPIQQQYQQPQPYPVQRDPQPYQQTPINGNNQSFPEWLKAVIMGSIIGAFVLGGVYLFGQQNKPQPVGQNNTSPTPTNTNSPNPNPTNSPTNEPSNNPVQNSLSREEAKELVWRWLQAKRTLFASPYDQELGRSITTGKAYIDNIQGPNSKGEPESSLEWLRNRGYYYTFESQNVGDVRGFEVDGNSASIQVIVTEYRTLHSNTTENSGGTYLSTYYLKNVDGVWKISDYKTERY
ncbi:MAG TPA: protein kinase, partial [Allocoleopsis sp.]